MISLNEFLGKNVRLVDCDNEVWFGVVFDFESKIDNDTDEDAIDLKISEPGHCCTCRV